MARKLNKSLTRTTFRTPNWLFFTEKLIKFSIKETKAILYIGFLTRRSRQNVSSTALSIYEQTIITFVTHDHEDANTPSRRGQYLPFHLPLLRLNCSNIPHKFVHCNFSLNSSLYGGENFHIFSFNSVLFLRRRKLKWLVLFHKFLS